MKLASKLTLPQLKSWLLVALPLVALSIELTFPRLHLELDPLLVATGLAPWIFWFWKMARLERQAPEIWSPKRATLLVMAALFLASSLISEWVLGVSLFAYSGSTGGYNRDEMSIIAAICLGIALLANCLAMSLHLNLANSKIISRSLIVLGLCCPLFTLPAIIILNAFHTATVPAWFMFQFAGLVLSFKHLHDLEVRVTTV